MFLLRLGIFLGFIALIYLTQRFWFVGAWHWIASIQRSNLRSLGDVFRRGRTEKCDGLAVGRPDWVAGAFGQIGDGPGFTAREWQNRNLRRARLAGLVFFSAAHKCDVTAIRRPTRIRVVLAIGHAEGRLISCGGYCPDGGFIAGALFVDYDTRECDTGAVGRKLWVGNPSEFEKVFFCDWTFAGATWICRILLGFGRQREQREGN